MLRHILFAGANLRKRIRTMNSFKPLNVKSKWSCKNMITTITAQNGESFAILTPGFHPDKYVDGDEYDANIKRNLKSPIFYINKSFVGHAWSSEPGGRNWENDEPVLEKTWMKQMPTEVITAKYIFTKSTWPFDPKEFRKLQKKNKVVLKMPIRTEVNGQPIMTGVLGRGQLGRFGPNGAADPIMVAWKYMTDTMDPNALFLVDGNPVISCDNDTNPILQVVIIKRKKGRGEYALPGGMNTTPDGKIVPVSMTLANEYAEETCSVPEDDAQKTELHKAMVNKILKYVEENGIEIYSGPVGDPRDTDNAWMNSTATIIPDWEPEGGIFNAFKHESGSDADGVFVIDWSPKLQREMYANHATLINNAYDVMRFLKENASN